jgi:hypothetical protein
MVAVLFATLLVADAPGAAIEGEKTAALQAAVDEAEHRWRTAAPSSFSYHLVVGGPFGYTTYVINVDGIKCRAKSQSTFGKRTTLWKPDTCEGHLVDELFTELRRQLSYAQERIELNFEPDYGYPSKASFQPHESEDQSEYFEISKFKKRSPAEAPNRNDRPHRTNTRRSPE